MKKKIVLECNPDEILAMALGIARKEIQHQPNKGEVCHYQEKEKVSVALVDEDPNSGQPKYLAAFSLAETRFNVMKMVRPGSDCIVLVLKPRLEEWIIAQCKLSSVNPQDCYLPADPKDLKKVINFKLKNFRELVERLLEAGNPGVLYLKSFFR